MCETRNENKLNNRRDNSINENENKLFFLYFGLFPYFGGAAKRIFRLDRVLSFHLTLP